MTRGVALTAAAASIHQASHWPPTWRATVAKKPSFQSEVSVMTPRHARSGSRYMRMTRMTASISASGNVLCGLATSPASVLTLSQ